jgi:membrane protein required for beta-lactamase induction
MDVARMIGIGIVMIVPTFVVGGAIWDIFHNWFAVLVWVIIMGGCAHRVIKSVSQASPDHGS